MKEVYTFVKDAIAKNPELKWDIVDAFELFQDEVNDGSSFDLEKERLEAEVKRLIKETV